MLILTLIFLILLVIFPLEVSNIVASSLDLCLKSVIPALFPFLIVSYIITETSIPNNYFTLFLSKLFNISPQSVPAYISGILCGYPIGGKMALELFEKGKIGKKYSHRNYNLHIPRFLFAYLRNYNFIFCFQSKILYTKRK